MIQKDIIVVGGRMAGLVKPLIKKFDLDIEMLPNPITLGIEDRLLRIDGGESLTRYAEILKDLYPESKLEVDRIIQSIHDAKGWYAAGKWVYSPAGGPTAIMTGRIAARKCK